MCTVAAHSVAPCMASVWRVKVVFPAGLVGDAPAPLPPLCLRARSAATACAICQSDFCAGDPLLRLPCGHCLHEPCGLQWLGAYSKKCPLCAAPVC